MVGSKPLPTNAWWLGFALGSGTGTGNEAFVVPYVVGTVAGGFRAYYPWSAVAGTGYQNYIDVVNGVRPRVRWAVA